MRAFQATIATQEMDSDEDAPEDAEAEDPAVVKDGAAAQAAKVTQA